MAEAQVLDHAATQRPAGLDPGLRTKLSIMMFLQYAAWGAWWSVLSKYMMAPPAEGGLSFNPEQVGWAYASTAFASLISPLILGQIADRWVPTQYLLVALHLLGAGCLYLLPGFTTFSPFFVLILAWAFFYVPTISLTNALSFHHISDAGRFFPGIRVFGTIGWIVAGLFVGQTLNETTAQPILLAAGVSAVLGLYCFVLPHTPPRGKTGDLFPPLRALGMLKEPQFALFVLVSFLIAILLAAYFTFTGQYLGAPPRGVTNAASWMTLGQFTEMLLLPLLPFFLRTIGMKKTLLLGIAAWGIRYGIFSLGQPTWLVLASLALHGICYDFFFVAAYIHVDNQASANIRASAQALINFVIMGIGMLLGNLAFGKLTASFTDTLADGVQSTDWTSVWMYPAIGVIVPVVVFALFFREKPPAAAARAAD
ncbi:MAG: xanthosine permease [Phycisphaerae bacterium]